MKDFPMQQTSFLEDNPIHTITNVATVPQRSPFRYPGGKTWFVPQIRQWLGRGATLPKTFVEPFAGGGIIGLTVAFERLATDVVMVEIDTEVAAVWKTILNGEGKWLAEQITTFNLTPETVEAVLTNPTTSVKATAFRTILKNRVNRGGILAAGAGKVKYGENGKGLRSRWYPETLKRRILDIYAIRQRIHFIEGDGMEVLKQFTDQPGTVFFIDPPYTAAGKKAGARLYTHAELDHQELFRIARQLKGDFLMTYDDTQEIRALAATFNFDTQLIGMKNTHHTHMTELVIGRDLCSF